jgi:hypothetical protein
MNYLVKCFIDVIYQYVVFRCIFPGFFISGAETHCHATSQLEVDVSRWHNSFV